MKKAQILFCLLISTIICFGQKSLSRLAPGTLHVIEKSFSGGVIDGYNLYLPKSYAKTKQHYPILLYLCGGTSVGGEIDVVKQWPIPKLLVEEIDMTVGRNQLLLDSFVVVAPHMIAGSFNERQWYQNDDAMKEIFKDLSQTLRIDEKRIYITGLSRGGHGTWGLLSRMGKTFAAAVPICGGLHGIKGYEQMEDLPIWVVHNEGDNLVNHSESRKAVGNLEQRTGEKFFRLNTPTGKGTSYLDHDRIFSSVPKEGHDAWTAMYESEEFYIWLLSHRKK